MNLTVVALGVLVVVLLYILYRYYTNTGTTLLSQTTLLNVQTPVAITDHPSSVRYAIGMWVFVQQWDFTAGGANKGLFTLGNVSGSGAGSVSAFSVYLDPMKPTLYTYVAQNTGTDATSTIAITDNFPLQRWTHVLVNVDSKYVDCYLDGKLVKSVALPNPAMPPVTDGTGMVNGYIGYMNQNPVTSSIMIAKLQRWATPQSPQDVWNTYVSGNGQGFLAGGSTGLNQYGLSLALMTNNKESNSYRLF